MKKETKMLYKIDNDFQILSPEKKLLYSILSRSILDLGVSCYAIRKEAIRFFECSNFVPFSFFWICEYLDLEPEQVILSIENLGYKIKD